MNKIKKRNAIFGFSGAMGVFFCITIFNTFYRSAEEVGMIIAQDVESLSKVFDRIHKDCGIIDFDAQKNLINFLNVTKFSGSEVGPMNLSHPEKWQGPYMDHNPTISHIPYQVVSTKNGYFITPGDGVVLPNKKKIGVDIILDKKADIEKMMKDSELLAYNNKPLATRLELGSPITMQFFLSEDNEF